MTIKLICLDADDTLWHNMRHFNATEDALVAMLQPFADAHITRETLIACETRNLKHYGYGAKGFTLSMVETATEVAGDAISKALIKDILHAGQQLLAHPVQLFDDVESTLEELARLGKLVLVTKGDLLHQETKLAASGLGDLFHGIEIVSDKNTNTFRHVSSRYEVATGQIVMAGDSLRSDIWPALNAGAWAAYIPQDGAWSHELADLPEGQDQYTRLDRLAQLPEWIESINRR